MSYIIATVVIVFVLSFVGVGLAQSQVWSVEVGQTISLSAFPIAGAVMVVIWMFVQRGTKRFREKWSQEHGMGTGPQQDIGETGIVP